MDMYKEYAGQVATIVKTLTPGKRIPVIASDVRIGAQHLAGFRFDLNNMTQSHKDAILSHVEQLNEESPRWVAVYSPVDAVLLDWGVSVVVHSHRPVPASGYTTMSIDEFKQALQ